MFNNAARACPMCNGPDGFGAKRSVTFPFSAFSSSGSPLGFSCVLLCYSNPPYFSSSDCCSSGLRPFTLALSFPANCETVFGSFLISGCFDITIPMTDPVWHLFPCSTAFVSAYLYIVSSISKLLHPPKNYNYVKINEYLSNLIIFLKKNI